MRNNRWKKLLSTYTLLSCMLLSLLPVPVLAAQEATSSDVIQTTLTIPDDAIYLSTPEDILALAENCRVNTWSIGKTIVLSNDIDMTDYSFGGIPTFGGNFLGQGHVIKGIELTQDGSVVGFFRYLQKNAIVENLTIEGNIQPNGSKSIVGGIVGNLAGTIRNCKVNGTISGYERIGGIAGINESTGVIENCTVSGMVYGGHFVGGMAGENHGVIRNCTNQSEMNTKSVQNTVSIEDITVNSLIDTESASTTTDIGGIAGISSGVIRSCNNYGAIGYQNMGYNIGGIAGTQNGFVTDCVNYANIQGRKEVGGIVGHMEPSIVLNFSEDTLQKLEVKMGDLGVSMEKLEKSIKNSSDQIDQQVSDIENGLEDIERDIEILSQPFDTETGEVDIDKLTAAKNDLSSSLNDIYTASGNLEQSMKSAASNTEKHMDAVAEDLDQMKDILNSADEGINLIMEDISANDTIEDTVGKVANCTNYGKISGDLNIGGISGVMAEENDLDEYEDTSIYGDMSLNITGQVRVVIRDCRNQGTIHAGKNYAGGIVGQMVMGAVLESVNTGNLDALGADYVGGIAGGSNAIIRNSSSKSVIAGDSYVGGIAGSADEVKNCYALVSIPAYTEKAGAIVGFAEELPESAESAISGNYYYIVEKELGGIDGISYSGAAENLDLAEFLMSDHLDDTLKTASVRFMAEGQEDVVLSVNAGESLTMDMVPVFTVEDHMEYDWEVIPMVDSQVLSMGETAQTEYISEESLQNILFDQTYQLSYDLKDTVIQSISKDDSGRSIILAEGTFTKNTTIEILNTEELETWKVVLSDTGINKLHYRIADDMNVEEFKLLVKNVSGNWEERAFVQDGSYIVFDFTDGESEFSLVENPDSNTNNMTVAAVVVCVLVVIVIMACMLKKRKKNK